MFLKKIELKGFKSFAFPTVIEFKKGLTVIVGPNGSGKSNINDALKWVLGESSKKTLRAKQTDDMIFSGSHTKEAASFAEVNLFFDNSNKLLEHEEDEIIITRKLYRKKNENQYFINREKVRRKDVKNLFLDTGLGNTDLSIISQGSVAKIAEARPQDLRLLLEEASGVSKYQIHKKEAVLKLEKVATNLEIFEVKLNGLKKQIAPLKKASEQAKNYLKIKEELTKIELPLIKSLLLDGYNKQDELKNLEEKSKQEKILIEKILNKLAKDLKEDQVTLLDLDQEITKLHTIQNDLQNNLNKKISFNGDKKEFSNKIKYSLYGINDLKDIIKQTENEEEDLNKQISSLKTKMFELRSETENYIAKLNQVNFQLDNLKNADKNYNQAVKSILDNKLIFNLVYGTVKDLIKVDSQYELALETAIGSKFKNIVVNNEKTIKETVAFLKKNKLGIATFIPAENVKEKFIIDELKSVIIKISGFNSILSDVIKADSKFKKVVSSLAGNIVIFNDLDSALLAAKFIQYRLSIVTLEGDIIYPGFTVKGGFSNKNIKKFELERYQLAKEKLAKVINKNEIMIDNLENNILDFNAKRDIVQKGNIRNAERLHFLEKDLQQLLESYHTIFKEEFDLEKLEIKKDLKKPLSLEKINNQIRNLNQKKHQLSLKIIDSQDNQQLQNKKWQDLLQKIQYSEINLDKIERLISENTDILNKDYQLTYQNLLEKDFKKLKEPIDEIIIKQQEYRKELRAIGYIDQEAIKRYQELTAEYQKLDHEIKELTEAKEKLTSTIDIMDQEMIKRIKNTYLKINDRFDAIFKTLFRGGHAKIEFIEPDNLLESGLEIRASAPGKSVKNLSLYSGGEKSLIAISLIFAINEIRNLPLLLLDEVEAALDEANVERFANFAKILNNQTQLIIVSHRPGTMEKADILYGVTMQEKGVTSIFNVSLDKVKEEFIN
ncbi:chromosome segregation protein SMC [Candidatus Hepatoplasma crinochetorum Av]|uniref:Chromosome partition protein Smc n=1 Tax=Candidatus Hepatoplasma crinochetorum Av TaxID=1427984 RepID=W8GK15_9MOLU|nr:AAA family ATPase [Candidatus Hepatoplasma crinochetorum]AHK22582.1 chromosome segregation protein SMC [Candidatus Hepatoplasma crinochetorum Av]